MKQTKANNEFFFVERNRFSVLMGTKANNYIFCLKKPFLLLQWELKRTKSRIFLVWFFNRPFIIFNRTINLQLETVIYLPFLPVNNSQSCQTRTNPASHILYPLSYILHPLLHILYPLCSDKLGFEYVKRQVPRFIQ